MNWSSMSDFVDMGGHALYVWGAYLMCLIALVWEGVIVLQRRHRAIDELSANAQLQPPDDATTGTAAPRLQGEARA